ncbi:MAG: TetR family transcriptional regulator, partial [Mesorhizobium sp.]
MLETVTLMKNAEARDALPEPARKGDAEKRGRKASKEVRQLQLIEATIDSLAKRGYAETTMADVAD